MVQRETESSGRGVRARKSIIVTHWLYRAWWYSSTRTSLVTIIDLRALSGFWQRASRFQRASPRKSAPFIVGPFPGHRNSLRRQMACRADDSGHLGVIAAPAWQ